MASLAREIEEERSKRVCGEKDREGTFLRARCEVERMEKEGKQERDIALLGE
jgi:hypothetical protein